MGGWSAEGLQGMRVVGRILGGMAAVALTVALLAGMLYAFDNFDELRVSVPTLDQAQRERQEANQLRAAADSAVAFAEEMNQPPKSTGVGAGFAFSTPPPSGFGDDPAHWCAQETIGYTIDFRGALLAGSTRDKELSRWQEAFADWTTASGGRYEFRYLGEASYPLTGSNARTYPIDPESIPAGQIAISYGVPPGERGRWDGMEHPALAKALGIAGVGPVQWGPGPDSGMVTKGFIVLDALDSQTDPRDVPVPYVHEAGHALGLSHVADPGQIMFTLPPPNAVIGPGDRRGITALARMPCN